MERVLAVTSETKHHWEVIAMLEATTCRCCVWINSRYTFRKFWQHEKFDWCLRCRSPIDA